MSVHCGIAGWPYSVSAGRLESLGTAASRFGVVEIGSTFREALRPEIATLWARKTAERSSFLFTAKLHRRFTHDRDLDAGAVQEFKAGLRPLVRAGKFGCLLMQFPWSFRFTSENREFLIRLRRTFRDFPLVAEMRHASWSVDEAVGTLIDYRIGFCNIDQPSYTKAMPPTAFLTSSIGYIRLHGRSCFRWFNDDSAGRGPRYDYLYSQAELGEWRKRAEQLASYATETFVVFNNDAGPKATANALEMKAMLRGETPRKLPREAQTPLFTEFAGSRVA